MSNSPNELNINVLLSDDEVKIMDLPDMIKGLSIGPGIVDVEINSDWEVVSVNAFGQRVWDRYSHTYLADLSKEFVIVDDHYMDPEVSTMMRALKLFEGLKPAEARRALDWVSARLQDASDYPREESE